MDPDFTLNITSKDLLVLVDDIDDMPTEIDTDPLCSVFDQAQALVGSGQAEKATILITVTKGNENA